MAVGGHYKDEKATESVYGSLREVTLWRFPKDTHTHTECRKQKKGSHLCTCIAGELTIQFLVFTSHQKSTHDKKTTGWRASHFVTLR